MKLNFEEFAPKFGMWADIFKPYIESSDMFELYQKLKSDAWYPDGRRKEVIVPHSDNVFNAFRFSNPNNVKVVWYLADPYPKKCRNGTFQATGLM